MSAPQPDYLAQAQEILQCDISWGMETCSARATALATMGILQQLTRIADMIAAARGEDAASAADRQATREHWRRQRENLEDSYRGD